MLYEVITWPIAGGDAGDETAAVVRDCNGNLLADGDTVVVIKDLKVKGASIRYGYGDWQGVEVEHLSTERMLVLCSPALLREGAVDGPADVLKHPVITSYSIHYTKLYDGPPSRDSA